MTQENQMTGAESLAIINSMIAEARKNFSKTAIFFLIWGVALSIAGVAEYLLMQSNYEYPYLVWPLASLIGGIISGIVGKNMSAEKGTATIVDRVMFGLWTSFFITLVVVVVACVSLKINPGSFIIVLTGLPTITTGIVIRFKPLIFGGVMFWILGLISFFIPHEYLPLFFAFSIAIGYIIPGIILRKAERNDSI